VKNIPYTLHNVSGFDEEYTSFKRAKIMAATDIENKQDTN
jgi:hypothetical protein